VARANLSAVHLHLNFGFRFLREVSGGLIGFLDLDEYGPPSKVRDVRPSETF
jgi:hypothetical protein